MGRVGVEKQSKVLVVWHAVFVTSWERYHDVASERPSVLLFCLYPGADPGFPVGGGADPLEGRQHTILSNFPKNCMKSRKFWAVGGRAPGAPPLNPPLVPSRKIHLTPLNETLYECTQSKRSSCRWTKGLSMLANEIQRRQAQASSVRKSLLVTIILPPKKRK